MDGSITELFGYLSKIHVPCPDQLLGGVDLEGRKVFDNTHIALFFKKLLQLGTADKIITADLLDADMLVDVVLQIVRDPPENFCIPYSLSI